MNSSLVIAILLGTVLGLGLLLVWSPLLWPRPIGARPVGESTLSARIRGELSLAGFRSVPVSAVVILSGVFGLVLAGAAQAVFGLLVLTVVALLAGVSLPAFVVRRRARLRRQEHRAVWPDVVDHLVASVRAGMSLPDALAALAELGPESTRDAFAAFEVDFGRVGDFGTALDRVKGALADPVADRILETLRMAREVGGTDLIAVLRGLATSLREDRALRSEVAARQSWVRNAARLGVAAPWVLLLLLASRPETFEAYDSPGGTVLLLAGVGVTVLAYRAMLALGRLPEERRWFR